MAYLHLPAAQRAAVLARAGSLLAPGGVLSVVGHDRSNLTGGVGGPQDPAVFHTPAEIAGGLPGLEVQRPRPRCGRW